MVFIHSAHSVYHCPYHLVLVTKYRKSIFNEGVFAFFQLKLAEISAYHPEVQFEKVNHDSDHVHFVIQIPPTVSVGKVVGIIKANTAREMKSKFEFLKKIYWGTDSVWSEGYFVSTVRLNESMIKQYVQMQGEKDAGRAKLELQ
jgi:putative transposase